MERLKDLMSQLKEQFDRGAEPSLMLRTAQLLEEEIRLLASKPAPAKVIPTKIAVMMPSAVKIVTPAMPEEELSAPADTRPTPVNGHSPASSGGLSQAIQIPSGYNGAASGGVPSNGASVNGNSGMMATPPGSPYANGNAASSPYSTGTPVSSPYEASPAIAVDTDTPAVIATPAANGSPARTAAPERGTWPFDPLAEKPTDRFTLSQKTREINDVIGNTGSSSLNEKLKSDIVELKSALNDTPVRDLRKAIGINDRYVFINQLFRGDEVMYERSLKTINGFRILPEAEYWMERELKVKLGWDENREATRHFYQLVKRRFS